MQDFDWTDTQAIHRDWWFEQGAVERVWTEAEVVKDLLRVDWKAIPNTYLTKLNILYTAARGASKMAPCLVGDLKSDQHDAERGPYAWTKGL